MSEGERLRAEVVRLRNKLEEEIDEHELTRRMLSGCQLALASDEYRKQCIERGRLMAVLAAERDALRQLCSELCQLVIDERLDCDGEYLARLRAIG